ncbi:hypothetical protein Gpo141_00001173 [Globisporangium polare]
MPAWFHRQQQQQHKQEADSPYSPQPLEAYLFSDDRHASRPMPMMEDTAAVGVGMAAASHDDGGANYGMRPSILEFRSTRFSRVNPQRAQMLAAMANAVKPQQQISEHDSDVEYAMGGQENMRDHYNYGRSTFKKSSVDGGRTSSTRTTEKTNADEDEETDDDPDDDGTDTFRYPDDDEIAIHNDNDDEDDEYEPSADESSEFYYGDDDDLLTCVMSMPHSAEVPLLEGAGEDEADDDVDAILCDPTRLPRTMVVDEHGFQISRESLLVSASRLGRNGGGSPNTPLKTGLLFKQGFGLLSSGGWKVRHVVLTSTKITFFREEQGRKRGEIDLAQCSTKSIEIMPRDSVYDGKHATVWRFAVRGKGGRRVLLAAYSEAEMKDWLRALHVALAVQGGAGMGRFTDFGVVPSGTFLADKSDGQLRSSANFR